MAKSLRSKRKRKLRAEKRIVNAKKELVKLKAVVSNFNKSHPEAVSGVNMSKFKELISSSKNEQKADKMEIDNISDVGQDESGGDKKESVKAGRSLSLKNEHGNYPVWMNKKKIKQIKQKIKRHNKNKGSKPGQITSRKAKKQVKRLGTNSNKPRKVSV